MRRTPPLDRRVADRAHHVVGVDRAQEACPGAPGPARARSRASRAAARARRRGRPWSAAAAPAWRSCERSKRMSPPSNQVSRPVRSASAQPSAESSTTSRSRLRAGLALDAREVLDVAGSRPRSPRRSRSSRSISASTERVDALDRLVGAVVDRDVVAPRGRAGHRQQAHGGHRRASREWRGGRAA